jgi:hypothetical protein
VPTHSLKSRALVLCVLLAVAGALPVCASGQKESPLDQANALIKARDYTGASSLLVTVQRDHPELADEIQSLQDQIFAIRDKSNALKKQLSQARAADDDVAMQSLLAQLEQLNPQDATTVSKSTVQRVAFLRLMNEATALLDQGKPAQALTKYLLPLADAAAAGFDMQKTEFDAGKYGALVTGTVRDGAARLRTSADQESSEAAVLAAVPAAVAAVLGQPLTDASPAAFDAATKPLVTAGAAEGLVRSAAASLSQLNRTIGANGTTGEAYLDYLAWLGTGRQGKTEGIAEAIRRMWVGSAEGVLEAAMAREASATAAALAAFDRGDDTAADAAFAGALVAGTLALKASGLRAASLMSVTLSAWKPSPDDAAVAAAITKDAVGVLEHAAEAGAYRSLMASRVDLGALTAPNGVSSELIPVLRSKVQAGIDAAAAAEADWTTRAASLAASVADGTAAENLPASARRAASAFTTWATTLRQKDTSYAVALAARQVNASSEALTAALVDRDKGKDLVNGTRGGKEADGAPLRPSEGLATYSKVAAVLAAVEAQLDSAQGGWQAEKAWVLQSPEFTAVRAAAATLRDRMRAEASDLARLTEVAQVQHDNAVSRRKEADAVYSKAGTELTQKLYDAATADYKSARDLYTESLLYEDDPVALARATKDVGDAIKKIDDATRAAKIDAVDAQVASGRKQFGTGEFLKAYNTLQQAQANWELLEPGQPNTALENLLDQVRNALQASSGRDLDPSDSRANVVNSYVSLADAKAAQAASLPAGSAQRTQLLNEALATIQNALTIVPVNRLASATQLKIKRLLTPDNAGYTKQITQEIQDTIAAYNAGSLTPGTAYFRLKDYSTQVSVSAAVTALMSSLEIRLGLKAKAVTTTDVAKSTSLYKDAVAFYNVGTADSKAAAKATLDEAIAANPDNTQAVALRRTILLQLGSPEANVLSVSDLAAFNKAVLRFQAKDYAGAYQIIQPVWDASGGKNKTYAPLATFLQQLKTLGAF